MKKNSSTYQFKLSERLINQLLLLTNSDFYAGKKVKTSCLLQTKFHGFKFTGIIFQMVLLFISSQICFSQVDTTRLKSEQQKQKEIMEDAQQKAIEQMKKMGITIDPNKKMTKEEAQKLKEMLLKKGKEIQTQLPQNNQVTQQQKDYETGNILSEKQIVQIANRFYNRSYKLLDAVQKNNLNQDYKQAEKEKFTLKEIRRLSNMGAALITFGNDHNMACVYLAAAVKNFPSDTLSVNNFGGYLRIIDSIDTSIPVLLYANKLFSGSPVILTQLGNSLFELNDFTKAEFYYKEALKYNPDFGQAHTSLCELYINQNRLKDAIVELFAGVKGMGASYNQSSSNFAQIQQQYTSTSGSDEMESKEEFWGEVKKQTNPSGGDVQSTSDIGKVKMPDFPSCPRVEDWLESGGYLDAVQSYTAFHTYLMSFIKKFQEIHNQQPSIPPDAILRDYPNERIALDCITEMFFNFSNQEGKKYQKSIDEITQRVNDAKEIYIKNYGEYAKEYASCIEGCSSDICIQECHRKYCLKECPNANKFNDILRQAYRDYLNEFSGLVSRQTKLLDDLYGFTGPWLTKLYSPYWSKIYAYEIKRVALSIVGNCYVVFPQPFQSLAHNDCGEDCSIFLVPITGKAGDVNKDDPKANNCPENTKFKIPIAICEIGLDCESIELGCTALVSGSVKRNFKHKNTTLFVGVGIKGNLGVVDAGAKVGVTVTADDHGEVQDVGSKMDLSVSVGVGAAKIGATSTATYTVMSGLKTKAQFVGGVKF